MYSLQVLVIVSFCVTASMQFTPFSKCKSGNPPSSLRIDGCTESPCKFKRGTDVYGEFDFQAVSNTDNLRTEVMAKVLGVSTNYPMSDPNACNFLIRGKCPVTKGDSLTYALKIQVLKSYPKVSLHLTIKIIDNNGNIHSCFEFNGKVVA